MACQCGGRLTRSAGYGALGTISAVKVLPAAVAFRIREPSSPPVSWFRCKDFRGVRRWSQNELNFTDALVVVSVLTNYLDGAGLGLRCVEEIHACGRHVAVFHDEFVRTGIEVADCNKF